MKQDAVIGNILAVDDSALMRELLLFQLGSAGFRVSAVESGRAALEAAARGRFDVVVLDVQMPGMDGVELGLALRSDPRTADILLAMHTTLPEAAVRRRFLAYDAFLQKPCAQVVRRIRELVLARRYRGAENQSE